MDSIGEASGPPAAWDLRPGISARLSQAVNDLHAATQLPRKEILAAIITAGLDRYEEIEASLGEQRPRAVIASLPPDTRSVPDVSASSAELAN